MKNRKAYALANSNLRSLEVKALVVYDSKWGNTEKVALAIAAGIGKDAKVAQVGAVNSDQTKNIELLIIGSPVIGGRPTKPIQEYLKTIAQTSGTKLRIATFDTRMKMKFAQKFGFAAVKMADQLREQGNSLISEPTGFIVKGQKGPLAEGELDRATLWGKELMK
jgi:flavodoxin